MDVVILIVGAYPVAVSADHVALTYLQDHLVPRSILIEARGRELLLIRVTMV